MYSIVFSADGTMLATGDENGTIQLWNVATGRPIRAFRGGTCVWSLAYDPNRNRLAAGDDDGSVRLLDVGTGKKLAALKGHTQSVNCVAFSPDGKLVASGSRDHTIKLWDADGGKNVATLMRLMKSSHFSAAMITASSQWRSALMEKPSQPPLRMVTSGYGTSRRRQRESQRRSRRTAPPGLGVRRATRA